MRNKILASMRTMTICSVLLCCLSLLVVLYGIFAGQLDRQLDAYVDLLSRNLNLSGVTEELRDEMLASASLDLRVTLIAPEGGVLYDSRADLAEMENHLAREEVQQALATGRGQSARFSDTLQEQTLYRARLLEDGNVLRVSRQRESMFGLLGQLFTFFGLVFMLTTVVSVRIASGVTNSIVQPINDIDLIHPENNDVYEELTPLLLRMVQQNHKLDSYMRELEARRIEFEAITDNMAEGLIVINARQEVLSVNGAAVRIFGNAAVDFTGSPLPLFSRSEDLLAVAGGALSGITCSRVVQLSGRYYRLIGNPVRRGEDITGAVVLAMDVNDVYLSEQSRREFTSNVSHELKTPITAVIGYAEIMKNGLVPPEHVGDFSGRIYDEALRLKQLVEDIIHLSRLDENRPQQRVQADLRDLALAAHKHLEAKAAAMGVTVEISGKATVTGVPEQLQEMIGNLMDNAIKYNREGGSVSVELGEENGRAFLRVADTGVGIEPEDQDRIFERFFRADKSHSRQVEGTGLGLSIVKHVAANHGAQVEVSSSVGSGTVFRVSF